MEKIALITGATSGIGEACAWSFAKAGYNIIITGRRKERLDVISRKLEDEAAVKVRSLCFDVRERNAVETAFGELETEWKNIDVLINNAGLALGRESFDEADIDDWEIMLSTNVNGILYVSRSILPEMIKKGSGHIFNIGSIAGKEVYEKGNVYCASKSAVDALTRSMRIDLLKHGIKVTGIHPGAVETEFSLVRFHGDSGKAAETYKGYTPLTAEDVSEVVLYCASLPPHVCINDLVLTCTSQANAFYFNKMA